MSNSVQHPQKNLQKSPRNQSKSLGPCTFWPAILYLAAVLAEAGNAKPLQLPLVRSRASASKSQISRARCTSLLLGPALQPQWKEILPHQSKNESHVRGSTAQMRRNHASQRSDEILGISRGLLQRIAIEALVLKSAMHLTPSLNARTHTHTHSYIHDHKLFAAHWRRIVVLFQSARPAYNNHEAVLFRVLFSQRFIASRDKERTELVIQAAKTRVISCHCG